MLPSVMPRLGLSVKLAAADNLPPSITSLPGVTLAGVAPRLVSPSMASVPLLMVVMPV